LSSTPDPDNLPILCLVAAPARFGPRTAQIQERFSPKQPKIGSAAASWPSVSPPETPDQGAIRGARSSRAPCRGNLSFDPYASCEFLQRMLVQTIKIGYTGAWMAVGRPAIVEGNRFRTGLPPGGAVFSRVGSVGRRESRLQ